MYALAGPFGPGHFLVMSSFAVAAAIYSENAPEAIPGSRRGTALAHGHSDLLGITNVRACEWAIRCSRMLECLRERTPAYHHCKQNAYRSFHASISTLHLRIFSIVLLTHNRLFCKCNTKTGHRWGMAELSSEPTLSGPQLRAPSRCRYVAASACRAQDGP